MDTEQLLNTILQDNEQTRRHFDVVAESLRSDIGKVAEGVTANTARLDRVDARLDKVDTRLDRLEIGQLALGSRMDSLETKVNGLDTRMDSLETKVNGLDTRMDHLETKLDGFILETRTNFDEVRASIKFSYAELDRRLTFLESGFKDLSSRMASLESRQTH